MTQVNISDVEFMLNGQPGCGLQIQPRFIFGQHDRLRRFWGDVEQLFLKLDLEPADLGL